MKIILKDDSVKEYAEAKSVLDVAKGVNEGLTRAAYAGGVDGEQVNLRTVIDRDCALDILTSKDKRGRDTFRCAASHIMAQTIERLYPEARLVIGPSVDGGFYYDLGIETLIITEDFPATGAETKKIVKEDLPLERLELPREDAIRFFREKNEPYKVEPIQDLPEDIAISLYHQGGLTDFCTGPHLMSTRPVRAIKLMKNVGAYWHGDEKNKVFTRIYGTAYIKNTDLEEYVTMLEKAKKRDHRKLSKEFGLFVPTGEDPGFPFFLLKGMVLKDTLMQYWREIHERKGYVEISTPVMLSRQLWETFGHQDRYKENVYATVINGGDFAIRPMNCPDGMLIYKSQPCSYRELPLRLTGVGLMHRREKSGAFYGLMRIRYLNQGSAHVSVTSEQVRDEIEGAVHLIDEVYRLFGFKYFIELPVRPEDFIGGDEDWEMATNDLHDAPEDMGLNYTVNKGDGAFYGSKIDFHLVDAIGGAQQCGTARLGFQLPQRFKTEYSGAGGEMRRLIMIYRICFGSIERFIEILTEHFAGRFPTWLAPVQVRVLPISDEYLDYSHQVVSQLKTAGIRCEMDDQVEKIGYKVREARNERIPYTLVVGQKEGESGPMSVRSRYEGDEGQKGIDAFINAVRQEIGMREHREERVVEETEQ